MFLAAAGPPLTGRRSTQAPAAAAALFTAAWSREPSSTTITRRASASPARQRASSAARSRTGMTTVTSSAPGWTAGAVRAGAVPADAVLADAGLAGAVLADVGPSGAGWAMPMSSRRRASARAFGLPGTGVPDHQPATCRAPAALSRRTRVG